MSDQKLLTEEAGGGLIRRWASSVIGLGSIVVFLGGSHVSHVEIPVGAILKLNDRVCYY